MKNKPLARMNVNVLVVTDRNAAVAHVSLPQADMETGEISLHEATGSAKREPGDSRDDMIAANLAMGRALENLGKDLQDTGRLQVELSMAEREVAKRLVVARTLLRGVHPPQQKLLPVDVIRERYGDEAAARAEARRQPHGRHARKEKKERSK